MRNLYRLFVSQFVITTVVLTTALPCFVQHLNAQSSVTSFRPGSWSATSTLNDVYFHDPDRGIVVGDHGFILRTQDGGRTWTRANSGVTCDLESVYFVDENTGWAVGGISKPGLGQRSALVGPSEGVVLKTIDGGMRWKRMPTSLPALRDVHFVSAEQGYAVGESSHFQPAGVYVTTNGGQSWSGSAADQFERWNRVQPAGDRIIGLNRQSQLARIDGNRIQLESMLLPRKIHLCDLFVNSSTARPHGLAVGEKGQSVSLSSNGRDWKYQSTSLDENFDLQTVHGNSGFAWAAGTPGTYIHQYDFKNRQWQSFNTGQQQSLRSVFFLDAQRGWAVGEMGTILRSRDGGKTWQSQRGKNQSVALMVIVEDVDQIPFELIGKYSAEENLLTSVVVVDTQATPVAVSRAKHACSQLGNTLFHHLPLTKPVGPNQSINREAARQLTKWIRIQRPAIVVSSQRQAKTRTEFDLDQAVVTAAHAAKDKYQFQEQLTRAGLTTFEVPRVLVNCGDNSGFHMIEHDAQVMVQNGMLLSDLIATSRAITFQSLEQNELRLMDMLAVGNRTSNDLFGPLKSGLYRRPKSNSTAARLEQIRKSTNKKKWLAEMESWKLDDQSSQRSWHHQIAQLTTSLDDETAGLWLYQLAQRYVEQGADDSAIAAHETLLRKYPGHWLTERSTLWLLQHFCSAESTIARQSAPPAQPALNNAEPLQESPVQPAQYQAKPMLIREDGQTRVIWKPAEPAKAKQASHEEPVENRTEASGFAERLQRAKKLAEYSRQRQSLVSTDPQTEYTIAILNQKFSAANSSTRFGQIANSRTASAAIKYVARREIELQKKEPSIQASTLMQCPSIQVKPYLDGKLDEQAWANASQRAIEIQGNGMVAPTRFLLARDQEYLYVAIVAQKIVEGVSAPVEQKRTRDPDMDQKDRVSLRFDVDRDFNSWFEFSIDHRGNVSERLGGNLRWNPDWYVARSEDTKTWTIEAAIPLSQIAGKDHKPLFGQHWGISLMRHNRQRTVSWPHRTDSRPYGLLKFQ